MSDDRKPKVIWTAKDGNWRIVAEPTHFSPSGGGWMLCPEKKWLDKMGSPSWHSAQDEIRSIFARAIGDLLALEGKVHT